MHRKFLYPLFNPFLSILHQNKKRAASDCRAYKKSRLGSGHIPVIPKEKDSIFVHVISGDWGLRCMKQPLQKIARKSLRSNAVADVKIFLIPGYISMDFGFVFIDFMLFFRFCKFTVNISICDINWFVCSLKVFHVTISSSFSVRRQLTSVLYLVQGWQNVLLIPCVTYVKISWLLLISKTFCFF